MWMYECKTWSWCDIVIEFDFYVFIWCSGIIESDDIQHITTEIDKAMNFSKKVQLLVESVKKKYRNRYVSLNSK